MADEKRRIDRLDQERRDEATLSNIPTRSANPGGDLDMGGGGPTGASGPGTPHRSNLDTGGGSPLAGALDDLPDMTGSDVLETDAATAGSGSAAGAAGAAGKADTWESTIGDADIKPPDADNANMGRGSDRFDASDAYTGVDEEDAVLEPRPGSSLERNARGRRNRDDVTGSGDSGTAGEGLGDMPGQGISPEDFETHGSN